MRHNNNNNNNLHYIREEDNGSNKNNNNSNNNNNNNYHQEEDEEFLFNVQSTVHSVIGGPAVSYSNNNHYNVLIAKIYLLSVLQSLQR